MTRTKSEIIKSINRLLGTDKTAELEQVPKYRLCAMLEELKQEEGETSSEEDLSTKIGVRVK